MERTLKFDIIKHYKIDGIDIPEEIYDKMCKCIKNGKYTDNDVVDWLKKIITKDNGDDVIIYV